MKNCLSIAVASLVLSACVATHERPLNVGEKTIVSDKVRAMVEAEGSIDIREKEDVYCERYRIVGTHMVKRVCFTGEERKALAKANQDTYYARFGAQTCLDQSSTSCQAGLEDPSLGNN